jgi:hypothetical protein
MYKEAIENPYISLFRGNYEETFIYNKLVIHDSMHNATNDINSTPMGV